MQTNNKIAPVAKTDFKQLSQTLRMKLLTWQRNLTKQNRAVVIVIAGDDRAGRHETIHTLLEWLDPRFVHVNAYDPAQPAPAHEPFLARFWHDLPASGHLGIYMREWTSTSIVQFLNHELSQSQLEQRIEHINQFEKTLVHEGTLLVKIWLHLSKEAHAARLTTQQDNAFFDPKDAMAYVNYDIANKTISEVLNATHSEASPWHVIASDDAHQRDLLVGQLIEDSLNQAKTYPLKTQSQPGARKQLTNPLNTIDLGQQLTKKQYQQELLQCQTQLRKLIEQARQANRRVICVFEGTDAAGKGGAIRRLVSALDVGHYSITPIAKPTQQELRYHYLWRFWKQLTHKKVLHIFDRSWYGRVLVERVEAFATPEQWQRAYAEINDFEAQLVEHGDIVLKFWLHISQDEQLKRFQSRETTAHKQHKITDEDYRNREKWPAYQQAIGDMLQNTHTPAAPWHLVSAQDKKYARIEVLRRLITTLEQL